MNEIIASLVPEKIWKSISKMNQSKILTVTRKVFFSFFMLFAKVGFLILSFVLLGSFVFVEESLQQPQIYFHIAYLFGCIYFLFSLFLIQKGGEKGEIGWVLYSMSFFFATLIWLVDHSFKVGSFLIIPFSFPAVIFVWVFLRWVVSEKINADSDFAFFYLITALFALVIFVVTVFYFPVWFP